MSDTLLAEVFLTNSLHHLTSLNIPAARNLSSVALNLFLAHCPSIASIQVRLPRSPLPGSTPLLQDLSSWEGLSKLELAQFRISLERENYALDAGRSPMEEVEQLGLAAASVSTPAPVCTSAPSPPVSSPPAPPPGAPHPLGRLF